MQITAATDADTADDQASFMFYLTDRRRYLTNDRFKVVARDTTEPPTPATGGMTTFAFVHSNSRERNSTTRNGVTERKPFTVLASSFYPTTIRAAHNYLPRKREATATTLSALSARPAVTA